MDFERAEYNEPRVIDGELVGRPAASATQPFALALLYGAAAALVGSIGYALVGLSGFMVSIVAIGIAWLIAKSMMTATHGAGGRPYQIAAVALTYFAVTVGDVLHPLWKLHQMGAPASRLISPVILKYILAGPFLALQEGLNGILGIVILFIGLRAAWRMAAGGPGFGQRGSGQRIGPFGTR